MCGTWIVRLLPLWLAIAALLAALIVGGAVWWTIAVAHVALAVLAALFRTPDDE